MSTVQPTVSNDGGSEFVTATLDDQLFGLPVLEVQDVLSPQKLAYVPLAPKEIAGALNLRGRIVTAIDLRKRLGLPDADPENAMSVVMEHRGELYSLLFDGVGEVISTDRDVLEKNPATLADDWMEVSAGVARLDDRLMVILEIDRILEFPEQGT